MKLRTLLLLIGLMGVLASCSTMNLQYDRDTRIDLSSVRSYGWLEKPDDYADTADEALTENTLLDRRIKKAVNVQLISIGLQMEDTEPDVLIDYHLGLKDKVEIYDLPTHFRRGRRFASHMTYVDEYKEGTLILDVLDAVTKDLIWRGIAVGKVGEDLDPRDLEKAVNKAVKQMFKRLPADLAP